MIAFIKGIVSEVGEDSLVLDLGGVGVSVSVPLARLQPPPVLGETLTLHTHLQIREDAWTLYGFSGPDQLYQFRQLLSVSGVGAKIALAVVNGVNAQRFAAAVKNKDVKTLTAISGVGKKIAERILLELKDKFANLSFDDNGQIAEEAPPDSGEIINNELLAALKQLGYTTTEARAFTLAAQSALGPEAGPEQLLRQALKIARMV